MASEKMKLAVVWLSRLAAGSLAVCRYMVPGRLLVLSCRVVEWYCRVAE